MRLKIVVALLFVTLAGYSQDSIMVKRFICRPFSEDVTIKFSKYKTLGLGVAFEIIPNNKHPHYHEMKSAYQFGADIEWGLYKDPKSFYGITVTNNYVFRDPFQLGFSFSYYNNTFKTTDSNNFVFYPFIGYQNLLFTTNFGYGFTLLQSDIDAINQRYPSHFIFQLTFRWAELRMVATDW